MSRENTGFLSVGGAVRRRQLSLLTRNSLHNDGDEDEDVDELRDGDDDDDLYNGNDDEKNIPDNNYSLRFKRGGTVGSACDVRASSRI